MRKCAISFFRLNALKLEATTSLGRLAGSLYSVTWIYLAPMYSGRSLKNFVEMQLSAKLAAYSFVSSSTSQVAKLHQQKYCLGMPAVRISFSNVSFFHTENLLVLISKIQTG